MKVHSQLSKEARDKRKPPPPADLVGALHDDIGKPPVKARGVKAAKPRRCTECRKAKPLGRCTFAIDQHCQDCCWRATEADGWQEVQGR